MNNDTNGHTNGTSRYTCSIRDSAFICCHNIDDTEDSVKITITITEEGNEGNNKEGKED